MAAAKKPPAAPAKTVTAASAAATATAATPPRATTATTPTTATTASAEVLPAIDPVADLLGGGRIVAFRVDLALAVGSIGAGLLLSQFWFWTNSHTAELRDGWFWMTCQQISEQTGMTREEQNTARRRLRDLGILEEDKRGVPMKIWFRVQKPQLFELLRGYAEAHSYLQGLPQDELKGIPEDELQAMPEDGNPSSYLTGMPKDRVGQYRKIARGKAHSLLSGIPEDITETSSETSSPISLPSHSEAAQAPPDAPTHKCVPPGGEGNGDPEPEGAEASDENVEDTQNAGDEPDEPAAFYWVRTLRRLRERVNTPTYGSHILSLTVVSIDEPGTAEAEGGLLTFNLTAASQFTRGWVRDRHLGTIRAALEEEMEQSVAVRIVGDQSPTTPVASGTAL